MDQLSLKVLSGSHPLKLKTWDEVDVYFEKHLTPVDFGPKGQPIYAYEDIMKLDIIYPDESE